MSMYIDVVHGGDRPTCLCGCGEFTKWISVGHGFNDYILGHNARIINNWGHNDTALSKSQKIRASMYRMGKIKVWNKSKTKLDDERVAAYGEKIAEAWTPSRRRRQSVMMSSRRLDGTIATLTGSKHPRWKGGASSINVLVRTRKAYRTWHDEIRANNGYKCKHCNIHESDVKNSTLDVHHDVQLFSQIISDFISKMNPLHTDDFDVRSQIADAVADYHVTTNVSGIPLCRGCHKTLHASLNF